MDGPSLIFSTSLRIKSLMIYQWVSHKNRILKDKFFIKFRFCGRKRLIKIGQRKIGKFRNWFLINFKPKENMLMKIPRLRLLKNHIEKKFIFPGTFSEFPYHLFITKKLLLLQINKKKSNLNLNFKWEKIPSTFVYSYHDLRRFGFWKFHDLFCKRTVDTIFVISF
jgi:hypothetical protein